MNDEYKLHKMVPIIAIVVIVAIGVAYMLFLASTWQQLQHDRRASFAKVDEILDRAAPKKEEPATDGTTESAS